MTEVISVRFKNKGKIYFFSPNGNNVKKGDNVIVETAKGMEYAECVRENHPVDDGIIIPPLRPVVRIATRDDAYRASMNKQKELEAFEICKNKIADHKLDMKLVDVEYSFDGTKILFCFTSEGRVDFRDLVKDLAGTFKMRIELRQIGVRDEARMLGGLGICGKPFCCAQFLNDFQPVSIKMAKTQGLSLNPMKISGSCGRLMCCLKYEQDAYEDLVKKVPKVDAFVETPDGKGMVTDVNLLRSRVRVKLETQNDLTLRTYEAEDIRVLGGKAQRAEYLAAVEAGTEAPLPKRVPAASFEHKKPIEYDLPEVTFKNHEEEAPTRELTREEIIQNNRKNRKKALEKAAAEQKASNSAEQKEESQSKKQRNPRPEKKQKKQENKPSKAENKPVNQEKPVEIAPVEKQERSDKKRGFKHKQNNKSGNAAAPVEQNAEPKQDNAQNENGGKKKFGDKFRSRKNKQKTGEQKQPDAQPQQNAPQPKAQTAESVEQKQSKPHHRPYYRKRNSNKNQNKPNQQ